MEIFALKGHKVKVTEHTKNAGYDHDKAKVLEHLELEKEYTVSKTIVHKWSTNVYLVGFPGISFNSCNFESISKQSKDKSKAHSDWERYN